MRSLKTVVIKGQKAKDQRPEPQTEMSQIQDSPQGYVNVQDMAEYLAIKPSTLYFMVEEKKVPHYRIGRQIRFKKSEIDEWMDSQRKPAIEVRVEARKVIRSLQKKSSLDVGRIIKKVVERSKKKRYNFSQEKPGGIEGLETEVNHGLI